MLTGTGNLLDLWSFGRQLPRRLLGSEKVGSFYVCSTCILTYFASVLLFKKVTSKCAVNCNTAGLILNGYLSLTLILVSVFTAFLAFKTFNRIKCKSSVSKFIHIFAHSDSDYTFW